MAEPPVADATDPFLGELTLRLLRKPDWIRRRVETIRFQDSVTLERRVTVDICVGTLRRALAEVSDGTGPISRREVLVPLALLRKGLLLDLDVRDDGARPLHVVTRDIDSLAGQAALLAELSRSGVDVAALDRVIRDTLYEVVHEFPSVTDLRRLEPSGPAEPGAIEHWSLVDVPEDHDVEARWASLIEAHQEFRSLLVNLTLNFMLMTPVDLTGQTRIVKFRYLDATGPSPDMTVREWLGIAPYGALVAMPAVGWAAREHLRVDAPPGLFVESAHLLEIRDEDPVEATPRPAEGTPLYERRISKTRAAVYTAGVRRGTHYLAIDLRPPISGLLRAARLTVLLSFLLLGVGAVLQFTSARLQRPGSSADAAVALLLIVPSLLSAFLVRGGEHDLLSDVLRGPRYAIAASSLAPLLAGAVLALGYSGLALGVMWSVLASFCLAVVVLLSVVSARSRRAAADVDEHSAETSPDEVVVIPREATGP